MKNPQKNEKGFIPLLVFLLAVIAVVIVIVLIRIKKAHTSY